MNNNQCKSLIMPSIDLPYSLGREVHYQPLSALELVYDSASQISQALTTKFLANRPFSGIATSYCGHQFGTFNPALGDGRLLSLSTRIAQQQVQIKGIGKTPFSFGHDGRLSLNNGLEETLNSLTLQKLGIPSPAIDVLWVSPDHLLAQKMARGALLVRSAPSFVRIGHFENLYLNNDKQAQLATINHCLTRHFNHQLAERPLDNVIAFLQLVVDRWALTCAQWQVDGFCHGTLNSDNMSILGLSLDNASGRFIHYYEPSFCTNPIDEQQRYAFGQQPAMIAFNLNILTQSLADLIPAASLQTCLNQFMPRYHQYFATGLLAKLNLSIEASPESLPPGGSQAQHDSDMLSQLLQLLYQLSLNYQAFFSNLKHCVIDEQITDANTITKCILSTYQKADKGLEPLLNQWLVRYLKRLQASSPVAPNNNDKVVSLWHRYFSSIVNDKMPNQMTKLHSFAQRLDSLG